MTLRTEISFADRGADRAGTADTTADQDPRHRAQQLNAAGLDDFRAGKLDRAAAQFRKAYALFPAPETIFNLGKCLERMSDFDGAAVLYRHYLEMSPDAMDADMIRNWAMVLDRNARRPSRWPWIIGGTGVAVGIAGAVLGGLALHEHTNAMDAASQLETDRLQRRARELGTASTITLIGSGAIITGAIAYGIWDRRRQPSHRAFEALISTDAITVGGTF